MKFYQQDQLNQNHTSRGLLDHDVRIIVLESFQQALDLNELSKDLKKNQRLF